MDSRINNIHVIMPKQFHALPFVASILRLAKQNQVKRLPRGCFGMRPIVRAKLSISTSAGTLPFA
jgi:hypothetical protein